MGLVKDDGTLVEQLYYNSTGLCKSWDPSGGGNWNTHPDNAAYNLGRSEYIPFGYLGMYRDRFTGKYHTHFREYDPLHARWLSEDPAGYADGLNLYNAYMGVNGIDPLGLGRQQPWDWHHLLPQAVFGDGGLFSSSYIQKLGMKIAGFEKNSDFIDQYGMIMLTEDHKALNNMQYNKYWIDWVDYLSKKGIKEITPQMFKKKLAEVVGKTKWGSMLNKGLSCGDVTYKTWNSFSAVGRSGAMRTILARHSAANSNKVKVLSHQWKQWNKVNDIGADFINAARKASKSKKIMQKVGGKAMRAIAPLAFVIAMYSAEDSQAASVAAAELAVDFVPVVGWGKAMYDVALRDVTTDVVQAHMYNYYKEQDVFMETVMGSTDEFDAVNWGLNRHTYHLNRFNPIEAQQRKSNR